MKIRLNKWTILLGLSILPSVLGYLLNNLIVNVPINGFMMFLLSFTFYLYWLYAGYKVKKLYDVDVPTLLTVHSVGIISLMLISYQIVVNDGFWLNALGVFPQMYFVPVLSLVARLDVFNILNDLLKLCSVALILMVMTFYIGGRLYIRRLK